MHIFVWNHHKKWTRNAKVHVLLTWDQHQSWLRCSSIWGTTPKIAMCMCEKISTDGSLYSSRMAGSKNLPPFEIQHHFVPTEMLTELWSWTDLRNHLLIWVQILPGKRQFCRLSRPSKMHGKNKSAKKQLYNLYNIHTCRHRLAECGCGSFTDTHLHLYKKQSEKKNCANCHV